MLELKTQKFHFKIKLTVVGTGSKGNCLELSVKFTTFKSLLKAVSDDIVLSKNKPHFGQNRPLAALSNNRNGAIIMNDYKDEVWVDVQGFEGSYQVSNYGRVKSFLVNKKGMIRSLVNKKGDYLRIILTTKRKTWSISVHRLVAMHFLPPPKEDNYEVNHIDCNKQNNMVSNLEWVSRKENAQHAYANNPNMTSHLIHYNQNVRPNTIYQFSLQGDFIAKYKNSKEAHLKTGVCKRNILQVASKDEYKKGRTRKQAGGFIWSFNDKL